MRQRAVRIPILLFQPSDCDYLSRRFRFLGKFVSMLMPPLKEVLPKLGVPMDLNSYCVGSFFSSLIYGIIFSLIFFLVLSFRELENPVGQSIAFGLIFWFMFLILHLFYPRILLKKIAMSETKDLLFALREVMMDIDSGVPLFDSMKNVSTANYGYISSDFERVTRQIEGGVPERTALKNLALSTESEYLKRAIWQLVNALESGAGTNNALSAIVQSLEGNLYREIKNYSSTLNFMMLIYMLASAALPSLGITLLVLLSAFGGLGVSFETLVMLVGSSSVMQIILIGYMSSTRPEIFGG
ncbi:type II secretion system F family protein [Candidatus Micrarchaeota archaeon]|nr:type II secretion system F family protein [Candidatus Micrarchaeota archaeon]